MNKLLGIHTRLLGALLLLLCSHCGNLLAQPPALTPPEQAGLAWLNANVQASGALAGESTSIATVLQARAETALALATLATAPTALSSAVAGNTDSNVDAIARRILAAVAAGHAPGSDLAALGARQNGDGGWALNPDYQSDPLDTALVLLALHAASPSASAAVSNGLAYLGQAAASDGGFGLDEQSTVYVSANVLLAANAWSGGNATARAVAQNASAWLLAARAAAPDYGTPFDNAYVLLGLSGASAPGTALPTLLAALNAAQLPDGSWADDPYLTALALRASWAASQPPSTPTSGDVQGVVVDQSTSQPLPSATLQLLENAGIGAVSASDGSFHLSGVPGGSYTLQVTLAGYQSRNVSLQVVAGQTLQTGAIALAPILTTANLSGVVRSDSGNTLQNVVITVGSVSTLTDANGAYQLLGLTPGAATIGASLGGYQGSSASVTFVAGKSYLFSPTLYPTNVTPPATSLQGRVIDATSRAPIAGASVLLNGQPQPSDASGAFVFASATPGAFVLSISASGYQTAEASGTLVSGLNDVGAVALQQAVSTTTLHGRVLDDQGNPIANASLAIAAGPSTSSAADGSYQLSGLTGTRFTLSIAASGYLGQTFAFSVSAPGTVSQDFHLIAQATTALTLGALTVAPGDAGANTNLIISTTLSNGGASEVDGVLLLEISDATGNLIGSGPLTDDNGFSIGVIALAAGDHLGIVGHWNTAQFAPGDYSVELRLVQPTSITRTSPLGSLIVNRSAPFTITPALHFSGSVAGDPPALQAGLNQSVHLTALLRNDGNQALPAQSLALKVIDPRNGDVAFSATAALPLQAVNALATVDFGSWLPPNGGNYQLQVGAGDAGLGALAGTLYVGNVASASFTVDPANVLAGTRNVHGNIHIAGVNPAQATITDPLAPLMRTATQNAISYNDTAAHTWIDTNRCTSCHIGNQALIGGELTRDLTSYNAFDRSVILNNVSTNQAPDGGLTQGYNQGPFLRRLGSLSLWGLLGYHNLPEFRTLLKHAADWVVTQQSSNGDWQSDYNNAWFDNDISMALLNISNLSHVDTFLKSTPATTVPVYASQPLLASQPVSSRAFLTVSKTSGNFYYTDTSDNAVHLVTADGTPVMTWTGLNDPRMLVERADGQVWVCSAGGTFKLNPDGSNALLSSPAFDSLELGPDGLTVWGLIYADTTIYQFDASGTPSAWLTGGPFYRPVFVNPDSDGSLYVTDRNNGNIYHVLPDKSVSVAVEIVQGSVNEPTLIQLLKDGDHWLLSTTNGIYRFSSSWEGQRIVWSGEIDQMARLADGSVVYVAYHQPGIMKLVQQTEDIAPALPQYEAALSLGTDWLQAQALASNDTLHLAQQLWGLGEAYRFYQKSDLTRAASIRSAMTPIATQLRANQNGDGGWGRYTGYGSDALVTAQVGIAIDYTDPSASDPALRKAVTWLLSQQQPDGSWASANGIMSTHESTTTMVAIWLPTILDRLGSIDAQVSVTFPPNIHASFSAPPPDQTSADGDGNVIANWQLTGVTDAGRDLGFDLALLDLGTGEVRAAAVDAHMTFNNSFTQTAVALPIAVPTVTAAAPVSLVVVTDQPAYPANATAQITTTLANQDTAEVDGTLTVTVLDSSGALVGTVTQQAVALPVSGTLPVLKPFAIGTLPPAQYTVQAVLDRNGAVLASGQTTFVVLPDNAAALAASTLHTDRQHYHPSDHVLISSRAENASVNVLLSDLSLEVQVLDATNALQFSHSYAIAQLLPGAAMNFAVIQPLSNAPPGSYTVKQDLRDNQAQLLSHVEASYLVDSTAVTGFGLRGSIGASPKQIRPGETLELTASASNLGNAALAALPLSITLVDPDLGTVLTQFSQTSSIGVGASVPFDTPWIAQGRVGATYLAILSATVGSGASASTLTLAQDSFQLLAPIAAGIQATGGTPQSATVTQAYPVALEATVLDTASQPLANVLVSFLAPGSGASVSFPDGASASTDSNGRAHVTVTANATAGAFSVSASAPGVANTALFSLQNLTPSAASLVASGGTPQTAPTGQDYPAPLQALVQDTLGAPMAGIVVTFSAPASGAGVTFPGGNVAVTDSNGHAQVPIRANATAGDFNVTASAPNVNGTAQFNLSNSQAPSADVGVGLSGPATMTLHPGGPPTPLTYTIRLSNAGPSDAQDVTLSATLPDGLSLTGTTGQCSSFPCSLGTLVSGQTLELTATFTLAPDSQMTQLPMVYTASSSTSDPQPGNNSASLTTQVLRATTAVVPVPLDWRGLVLLLLALLMVGTHAARRVSP